MIGPLLLSAPAIDAIVWSENDVAVGRMAEARIEARATFKDPDDPADVRLDATIVAPDGTAIELPGFRDDAGWRVRWTPLAEGEHRVSFRLTDKTGVADAERRIRAGAASGPGFVGISTRDRRYFAFRKGDRSFFPIGTNLGWGGTADARDGWITKLAANGGNWIRIWLAPGWTTFGIEEAGPVAEGKGLGRYRRGKFAELDRLMRTCREKDVYVQFCLQSYNDFRDRDAFNEWEKSPWNLANGGPLRIWSELWDDEDADRLMRRKLRTLVARYAADPNLFAWEFFNEVDMTRDYRTDRVRGWHVRMAAELDRLDPYDHPRTTSFAAPAGDRAIDTLPGLDFVQSHTYDGDPVAVVASTHARKLGYGKPHFFGEVGADAGGPRDDVDPDGLQFRDPMWISLAWGLSGAAMPWWWDSYIAPRDLWGAFRPLAETVKGVDFPGEEFRVARPTLAYAGNPRALRVRDLSLGNGPRSWSPSPANRPRTVVVQPSGKIAGGPVSGVLHGVRNHPELHNPLRIRTAYSRPTTLEIAVGDVSGFGGAKLTVEMNGRRILTRDFPDPDDSRDGKTLTKFAGPIRIPIPRGGHVLTIRNPGRDWVMVNYRILGGLTTTKPPLEGWGSVGTTTAFAWIRQAGRSWKAVAVDRRPFPPFAGGTIALEGLASGRWRVTFLSTRSGRAISSRVVEVRLGGVLRSPLPTIEGDVAMKAVRV